MPSLPPRSGAKRAQVHRPGSPRDPLAHLQRLLKRATEHLSAATAEGTLLERSTWLARGSVVPSLRYAQTAIDTALDVLQAARQARTDGEQYPVSPLSLDTIVRIAEALQARGFAEPMGELVTRIVIPSQTFPDVEYVVSRSGMTGLWSCTCRGYQSTRPGHCKHTAKIAQVIGSA
jgi:hypothetical protein